MIGVAATRGPGGLALHLGRVDTNEQVIVRADLSNDCSLETEDALADFAALGAAQNIEKCLLHVALSPALPLTLAQERRMISLVREVYGISAYQPCHVVQHIKPGPTARPSHYHLIFPRYDSGSRKLISSSYSHIKNERTTLQLELEFGHPLVPGPHLDTVRETLQKEFPELADGLDALRTPARRNDSLKVGDIAKAHDHGLDLAEFQARVLEAWKDGLTVSSLERARARLAHGTRALMVVDLDTGSSHSLVRLLNTASKAAGEPLRLKQADLSAIRANVPATDDLPNVSRLVIADAVKSSAADVKVACAEAERQAQASFDIKLQRQIRREAEAADAATRLELVKQTIKGQVAAIRIARQESARIRRETLMRARRIHNFWSTPGLARSVGVAAGVMTGSLSVGLALMAATALVAGFRRWKARHTINSVRQGRRTPVRNEVRRYYDQVNEARRFDLASIPTTLRVVAGALYRAVEDSKEPDAAWIATLDAEEVGLADRVAAFAQYNVRPGLRARMLDMYDPAGDADALARAVASVKPKQTFETTDKAPAWGPPSASIDPSLRTFIDTGPLPPATQPSGEESGAAGSRPQMLTPNKSSPGRSSAGPSITMPQRELPSRPHPDAVSTSAVQETSIVTEQNDLAAQEELAWSADRIPENLRPLAGVYAYLLFVEPPTMMALAPALEEALGPHAQPLGQSVHAIKKDIAKTHRTPKDDHALLEYAVQISARDALLRMAYPLMVDPSKAEIRFNKRKVQEELEKNRIKTKGIKYKSAVPVASRADGSRGRN